MNVAVVNPALIQNYKKGDEITLQIVIEDTGIGIPNDQLEKIFEHFSRLTVAYQGIYKGAGLGLYTVKHYVQAMGGRIEVASEVGKGSCFTLTLPFIVEEALDRPTQSPLSRDFTTGLEHASSLPNKRISSVPPREIPAPAIAKVLVVEDSPTAALVEKLSLERLACRVDIANNGTEAIEKVNHHAYDLIFMDVGLPDISGIEVTQRIRALSDRRKSRVPIVALTAHVGDDQHDACLKAGMNEVLTKPPQPLALESVLEHWVWLPRAANEEKMSLEAADTTSPISASELELSDLQVIDWEGSLACCRGDEAMLRSLLPALGEDLKQTQQVIARAYPTKDVKTLRDELHRCLGGVLFFKLPQIKHAITSFQAVLHEEPLNLDALENAHMMLEKALKAFWEVMDKGNFTER